MGTDQQVALFTFDKGKRARKVARQDQTEDGAYLIVIHQRSRQERLPRNQACNPLEIYCGLPFYGPIAVAFGRMR